MQKPRVRSPASHAFRGALLRGLAVLSPPLLTVLIVVWAVNTTKHYFLEPVTGWAREALVLSLADIRTDLGPVNADGLVKDDGRLYRRLPGGEFIPQSVYDRVAAHPAAPLPTTGAEYYQRYIDLTYLPPYYAIPFFLIVFILFLYFLGRFMAVGIGVFFAGLFERVVLRVPGGRAVYSAVKQVSDFLFSQRELQVTRIVAVEYPRKGTWSIGFVTGESFAEVQDAAGEPVLSVMVPYSPVPVTGCTIMVRKSECIDLNITFDQACQFIVSCGVVVPHRESGEWRVESG